MANKKIKYLLDFLKLALAVSLLCYIIFYKIDFEGFKASLTNIRWHYFAFAIFLHWVVIAFGTHRLQILLKAQSVYLGFWKVFRLNCIGFFFNLFALGSTGGDFVKAFYVAKEANYKKTESVTIVLLDRLMGLFSVLIIAIIAISFISLSNPNFKDLLPIVCLSAGIATIIVTLVLSQNLWKKLGFIPKLKKYVPQFVQKSFRALHLYKNHKTIAFVALLDSIILQLIMCLVAGFVGLALNFEIDFYLYFIIMPIGTLVMSLPISPCGLGTGDLAFMNCFERIGIGNDLSASFMILFRIVPLTISFGGFIFWLLPQSHYSRKEMVE